MFLVIKSTVLEWGQHLRAAESDSCVVSDSVKFSDNLVSAESPAVDFVIALEKPVIGIIIEEMADFGDNFDNEVDPAAEFLAREQNELGAIIDDDLKPSNPMSQVNGGESIELTSPMSQSAPRFISICYLLLTISDYDCSLMKIT